MTRFRSFFPLLMAVTVAGCITRPGMNANCQWPPESPRPLDLSRHADARHLVIDAELVAELVDRYRFALEPQQACEARLIEAVARTHVVTVADVERAGVRIPDKGLDLPVNIPVAVLFILAVVFVARRIERRFSDEPAPVAISMIVASVVLTALFVMVGEFWTSILQMIRVASFHVGGRVQKLPWLQHERQIFAIGLALFWVVVLVRSFVGRRRRTAKGAMQVA